VQRLGGQQRHVEQQQREELQGVLVVSARVLLVEGEQRVGDETEAAARAFVFGVAAVEAALNAGRLAAKLKQVVNAAEQNIVGESQRAPQRTVRVE